MQHNLEYLITTKLSYFRLFFSKPYRSTTTTQHNDAQLNAAAYDGSNESAWTIRNAANVGVNESNAAVHAYASWNADDAANDGSWWTIEIDVSGWSSVGQCSAGVATETDIPRLQVSPLRSCCVEICCNPWF